MLASMLLKYMNRLSQWTNCVDDCKCSWLNIMKQFGVLEWILYFSRSEFGYFAIEYS